MLQIAVCEDEKAMGSYLKQLIDKRLAGRKEYQIEVFEAGWELLESDKKFDIFFLDIDLKDMSGIDMARKLRETSGAVIIFVTALKEYVFDAFDVQAFQYLLKPVNEEKFFRVLDGAVAECLAGKGGDGAVIAGGKGPADKIADGPVVLDNKNRLFFVHIGLSVSSV